MTPPDSKLFHPTRSSVLRCLLRILCTYKRLATFSSIFVVKAIGPPILAVPAKFGRASNVILCCPSQMTITIRSLHLVCHFINFRGPGFATLRAVCWCCCFVACGSLSAGRSWPNLRSYNVRCPVLWYFQMDCCSRQQLEWYIKWTNNAMLMWIVSTLTVDSISATHY